jgi:hypothetical protein
MQASIGGGWETVRIYKWVMGGIAWLDVCGFGSLGNRFLVLYLLSVKAYYLSSSLYVLILIWCVFIVRSIWDTETWDQ